MFFFKDCEHISGTATIQKGLFRQTAAYIVHPLSVMWYSKNFILTF